MRGNQRFIPTNPGMKVVDKYGDMCLTAVSDNIIFGGKTQTILFCIYSAMARHRIQCVYLKIKVDNNYHTVG